MINLIEEHKRQAAKMDALKAKLQAQIEGLRETGIQIDQHDVPQWILEDQ